MCVVTVRGFNVFVNGMQFGSTYSSHDTAIHQGQKIHEKHYPTAKFEVIPEPIPAPVPPKILKQRKQRASKIVA
jgi:hypothetical protein